MAILFVGNTIADFVGTLSEFTSLPSGMSSGFTASTIRDSAYSPNFLRVSATGDSSVPFFARHLPPVGDYWLHFRVQVPGTANDSGADGDLVLVYDENNNIVGGLDWQDGSMRARAGSVFSGTTLLSTNFAVYQFDLQIIVSTTEVTTNVYSNGTLISSATDTVSLGKPVRTVFTTNDIGFAASAFESRFACYSEFIITDNEPTLGWRLATLQPVNAGHHTALGGTVSGLISPSDGQVLSGEAGQKASWTLSSYNGPTTPAGGVRAVIAKTKSNKGLLGPQNIRPFLRISGTDYEASSDITPNASLSGEQGVFDVNPATGLAWATGDLTGIEQGIEVKT